jgi:hypothetical protein
MKMGLRMGMDRNRNGGETRALIPKSEVRCEFARKDLRQQGNGIKRDGQNSPARDQCSVVG